MFRPYARFWLALPLLFAGVVAATPPPAAPATAAAIDFPGFLEDSRAAFEARSSRLLSLDEFLARAAQPGALLLDTRSAAAYGALHLAGAAHLEFSELTADKLEQVVGDRDRVVLIYCNNNFVGGEEAFPTKAPPAALNIPTFVALWTYGYRNVYELGELVDVDDPRLRFEGTAAR